MPIFDLEDLNPGAWFDYQDGRVKIRAINDEDIERISKEVTETVVEYKKFGKGTQRQRFESIKTDPIKSKHMLWDTVIEDWERFKKQDGTDLECNLENKILLMSKDPEFNKFVNERVDELSEDEKQLKEEREKN